MEYREGGRQRQEAEAQQEAAAQALTPSPAPRTRGWRTGILCKSHENKHQDHSFHCWRPEESM